MKKLLLFAFVFVILIGGAFFYIKATPPLVTGAIYKTEDEKTIVIEIGNKGFADVKVTHVKVNNHGDPNSISIQESNALEGFVLNPEANEKIEFKNVEEVSIPKKHIPEEIDAKQDEGKATEEDKIYGLTVTHHEHISNLHIKYKYLGIVFNKNVLVYEYK